jgi:hypothetical protein
MFSNQSAEADSIHFAHILIDLLPASYSFWREGQVDANGRFRRFAGDTANTQGYAA